MQVELLGFLTGFNIDLKLLIKTGKKQAIDLRLGFGLYYKFYMVYGNGYVHSSPFA